MASSPSGPTVALRPGDLKSRALSRRKEVGERGWSTGYKSLDEIISYKRGYSTIVYSYSHSGKTQFTIDQCVNLAMRYGLKSAVYLTEAGDPEEVVLEIAQTYMKRSLADFTLTDDELDFAIDNFVDKYFYIIQAEGQMFSIKELANSIHLTNEHFGVKIDVVVIDHFGNLEKDEKQKYFKTDENVKFVMQTVNKMSKTLGVHTFILFHTRDTEPIKCPVSNIYYLPKPEHHNISGGQQANYQGYQMIAVWRPVYHPNKFGIIDPATGVPYELNETRIIVSKSKPKHIGMLGERPLFFNLHTQSYQEIVNGTPYYPLEYYNGDSALFSKEGNTYPSFKEQFDKAEKLKKQEFIDAAINESRDGITDKPKTPKELGF